MKTTTKTALSIPIVVNGMNIGVLPHSRLFNFLNPDSDKVLVLIQLNGGNDGLNTLIPIEWYDNLANARDNVVIPENRILMLNDKSGLHPAMTGLKNLWDNARVTFVQSVGYPNQNRSHFRSTDIWTSGSNATEFLRTGWVGRYFDTKYAGYPVNYPNAETPDPIALTMSSLVSETCQGVISNYSLALNDPFSLSQLSTGLGSTPPATPYGEELSFLRTAISQTNLYSDVITGAAQRGSNLATYPTAAANRLAQQLKNVALLISGGLQTKVYICNIGGFDTHSNQVDPNDTTIGTHANLLGQVSEAISAFQEDLRLHNLEERVIGMTFSEFGRQIMSNGSNGTDHGTAAPLIVFGSCIQAGLVGDNPEIPANVQPQEGVAMQHDFRDVYGSILMDWFEVEENEVKDLLYDGFTYLPVIQPCSPTRTKDQAQLMEEISVNAFPNPFKEQFTIRFKSKNEKVRLSIFDTLGHERQVILDKKMNEGDHNIPVDCRHLTPGNYYFRLEIGLRHKTKMVIKIG